MIHPPKHPWGKFAFFFLYQFVGYFLIVANTRAYTQANYSWTAVTDTMYATQQFIFLCAVARDEENDYISMLGYVAGGLAGSLLSIWMTVHVYGK